METPDPFALQPLLYPALPADPTAPTRTLRCAEPFGRHLYLGSSDGRIYCYLQPRAEDGGADNGPSASTDTHADVGQSLRHVDTRTISKKAIERILLLPPVAVALVLSESVLTFHELPSFLPIPSQVLPHIKGVAAVALDDAQVAKAARATPSAGLDAEGLANLCIIRRKAIMLVKFSADTWRVSKEIPFPGGATNAKRFGRWLCISTTSEYNVVDLHEATMSPVGLPISQTSEAPSASSRPSIVPVELSDGSGRCEFLITSHTDELTLGAFVSQEGEPTAKLLEWSSHPRALALDFPYLHALLRNDTVDVHNLLTMDKEQTMHLPSPLEPRILSSATSQLELMQGNSQTSLSLATFKAERGQFVRTWQEVGSWKKGVLEQRRTRSRILLTGKNTVQCLCRGRGLDAAVKAVQRGDFSRAEELTHRARQQVTDGTASAEILELQYIDLMMGAHCLRMVRLEDAATHLLFGHLDHRIFASMFPSLSHGLLDTSERVEMFVNVMAELQELGSMETFPSSNIALNYTPPLSMESDNVLQTLLTALQNRVRDFRKHMLATYRQVPSLRENHTSRRLLDTMHARQLIADNDRRSLTAFLSDTTCACDIDLIEPSLASMGCFAVLARRKEEKGLVEDALELQSRLLDGDIEDPDFQGTLQAFADLLSTCSDASTMHRYGIWLVQRDTNAGVKALTRGKGNVHLNERATLEELRRTDQTAAAAFLEAITLHKKQQDPQAHRDLLESLLQQTLDGLQDAKEGDAMRALTKEYSAGAYAESFAAHLAIRAEQYRTIVPRLKLMMLLQGSHVLDVQSLLARLEKEDLLAYEQSILLGKLERDEDALERLATHLRDANSAETYCSQARHPLSVVILQSFDMPELKTYVSFVQKALKRAVSAAMASIHGDVTKPPGKIALLKVLLRVYMERDVGNEFQVATSHLLNTQAMHLSAGDVLETVPGHWTVQTLETFLSRSLRRDMHRAKEGHIQRAMALAQNLEVTQDLWAQRRALGGVIEDGESSEEGGQDVGAVLAEKAEAQEGLQEKDVVPIKAQ